MSLLCKQKYSLEDSLVSNAPYSFHCDWMQTGPPKLVIYLLSTHMFTYKLEEPGVPESQLRGHNMREK